MARCIKSINTRWNCAEQLLSSHRTLLDNGHAVGHGPVCKYDADSLGLFPPRLTSESWDHTPARTTKYLHHLVVTWNTSHHNSTSISSELPLAARGSAEWTNLLPCWWLHSSPGQSQWHLVMLISQLDSFFLDPQCLLHYKNCVLEWFMFTFLFKYPLFLLRLLFVHISLNKFPTIFVSLHGHLIRKQKAKLLGKTRLELRPIITTNTAGLSLGCRFKSWLLHVKFSSLFMIWESSRW